VDINFLMMNQISGLPITNTHSAMTHSLSEGVLSEGAVSKGFEDLLGLVENLETAELSSAVDAESNWTRLMQEMTDSSEEVLSAERNIALSNLQLNAGMLQKSFGQVTPSQKSWVVPESLTEVNATNFSEFQRQTASLDSLQQQIQWNLRSKEAAPISQESVAAWTVALSSGEVTSVEVGDEPVKTQNLSDRAELSRIQSPALQELSSDAIELRLPDRDASTSSHLNKGEFKGGEFKGEFKREFVDARALNAKGSFRSESSTSLDMPAPVKVASEAKFEAPSLKEEARTDFSILSKDPAAKVTSTQEKSSKLLRSEEFQLDPQVKKITEAKAKPQAQNARDFMLDRAVMSAGSQGQLQDVGALKNSVTQKIDSKVLDFVVDKVEQLQAKGGGMIKVGLDTKGEGSLEIKVALRAGKVDVHIGGSDAALTRELNKHKSELMSRLEKNVDVASLDIGARKSVNSSEVRIAAMDRASSLFSSDEMLRSLTGAEIARSSDESWSAQRNSAHLSIHSSERGSAASDGSQEFARDERREQAMNQWANFSHKMRKSA
jgi:hypothetical protein